MGSLDSSRGCLFLFKFGDFKKITVFWPDFQRVEKMYASLTKLVNRSFCSENMKNSNL